MSGVGQFIFSRILGKVFPAKKNIFALKALVVTSVLLSNGIAMAAPSWSLESSPASAAVGAIVELTYTFNNAEATPVSGVGFSHTLPGDVTLGQPGFSTTNCNAIIEAPNGGSTVSVTSLRLGSGHTCLLKVFIVASSSGTYDLTTGELSYVGGSVAAVSSTLVVDASVPSFAVAFSPSSVVAGASATMSISLENETGSLSPTTLTVNLPEGLVVSTPTRAVHTCHAASNLAAGAGSGGFTASMYLDANSTCTVEVEVLVESPGVHSVVVSGTAGVSGESIGTRQAEVTGTLGFLKKLFIGEPAIPGGTLTVSYTITHFDRYFSASDISFSDDFSSVLPGASLSGLPRQDICGVGSELSGMTTLQLTGATLSPEESCTFEVSLALPGSITGGDYSSATSVATATVDGATVTYASATDSLWVQMAPLLTPTASSTVSGDSTTLRYILQNPSATEAMTDITFLTDLTSVLPYPISATLPDTGFCGASATAVVSYLGEDQEGLLVSGASLEPGASCTFEIEVAIVEGMTSGTLRLVTSALRATVGAATVYGASSSMEFNVVGAPRLTKGWSKQRVAGGDSLVLTYVIHIPEEGGNSATEIQFTDDLNAVISGMVAVGLPQSDICGVGSSLSGTSEISLSAASLEVGETCTFAVTVEVPSGLPIGSYDSQTSNLGATVDGVSLSGSGALATFFVDALTWSQSLSPGVIVPGATVTAAYSFSNTHSTEAMTLLLSPLRIDTALSLTVLGLPEPDVCGNTLTWTNGLSLGVVSIEPGAVCAFSVEFVVDAAQAAGEYSISAGSGTSIVDEGSLTTGSRTSTLLIADPVVFHQDITADSVLAGEALNVSFTLASGEGEAIASAMSFTHGLDDALSGWVATNTPLNDICGAGSSITGTTALSFTGGSLGAGESCTFGVETMIPATALVGFEVHSTPSSLSLQVNGQGLSVRSTTDSFTVTGMNIAMAFGEPAVLGGSAQFHVTLTNPNTTDGLDHFSWVNDFEATLNGLAVTSATQNDVCGTGSALAGTSVLTLQGASLGAGESCSYTVTLGVPAMAMPGIVPHNSGAPVLDGIVIGPRVSANLELVAPIPVVSATLFPALMSLAREAAWVIEIDNSVSPVSVGGLGFSVPLPDSLVVGQAGVSTTCSDATLLGDAGATAISFSGGTVSALSSCTVTIPLTAQSSGEWTLPVVTLSTALGTASTTPQVLRVDPPPLVGISVLPAAVGPLGTTTLKVSFDNTQALLDASALELTFQLPQGLAIAEEPQAVSSCGGTITGLAGATALGFSEGAVTAGSICTVQLHIQASAPGNYSLAPSAAGSSLGVSSSVPAVLTVDPIMGFSLSASPGVVWSGQETSLTYAIDHSAGAANLTGLGLSHALPSGMTIVGEVLQSVDCGGTFETVGAIDGTAELNIEGALLEGASMCSVSIQVRGNDAQDYTIEAASFDYGSGQVLSNGASVSVSPLPLFGKGFLPEQVNVGEITRLTFVVDNRDGLLEVDDIAFSEVLPPSLAVAAEPDTETNCPGGQLQATAGGNEIVFSAESLGVGELCSVSLNLKALLEKTVTLQARELLSQAPAVEGTSALLTITSPPAPYDKTGCGCTGAGTSVPDLAMGLVLGLWIMSRRKMRRSTVC